MNNKLESKFTGWSFILAAIMLGGGWAMLPHQIGEYLVVDDFSSIGEQLWTWIWIFRVYIFGWVGLIIASVALAVWLSKNTHKILITPGLIMLIVGTFTLAIGSAFYYNYGAWGVGMIDGKSTVEIQQFMNDILYTNQYVTCFMRFGRIFSGVGLVLLGFGFIKGKVVQPWLGIMTLLLGFSAMGIILFIPEYFEYYKPVFYAKVAWMGILGISILRK